MTLENYKGKYFQIYRFLQYNCVLSIRLVELHLCHHGVYSYACLRSPSIRCVEQHLSHISVYKCVGLHFSHIHVSWAYRAMPPSHHCLPDV